MRLGEREGCYISDEIDLVFSPANIGAMAEDYKKLAEGSATYSNQERYHKIADYLRSRYLAWRMLRDEKDERKP